MTQPWRIMVVDDEDDARKMIELSLGEGYEIVEARNGLDALEKIEDSEPDLIIMDIMMPLMDGYQATEAIRNMPDFKNIDVIFLTAKMDTESIKKSYASGANLFLSKPCEPERLKRNITLFFEQSPPKQCEKKYTLEELKENEKRKRKGMDPLPSKRVVEAEEKSKENSKEKSKDKRPKGSDYPTPPPDYIIPPDEQYKEPPKNVAVATPVPEAEPRPETPEPIPAYHRTGGPQKEPWRVMVIDPDPEIVDIVLQALGNAYHISDARDGLSAIEKIVQYEPDLLIVDALMPKLSAFQLVQMLRKSTKYMLLPIVVISARATQKDHEYAQQLGASDFMPKPLDTDKLASTVKKRIKENPRMPKRNSLADIRRIEKEKQRKEEDIIRQRLLRQDSEKIQQIFQQED